MFFNFIFLIPVLHDIVFTWRYFDSISTVLYKPASIFKQFSFIHLLDVNATCLCNSAKRLKKFLDPLTISETSCCAPSILHVRTMDTNIIQHTELRKAVSKGMNHIPLRPTCLGSCIALLLEAFDQLVVILQLAELDFPIVEAKEWIQTHALERLKTANRKNLYGFRRSGSLLLSLPAVKNELKWLTENFLCAGLDKAANNCSFICARHMRLMAYERLNSLDFEPCKENDVWMLPTHILDKVNDDLKDILPEIATPFQALPYLMATFKQHKMKYRWLTNAYETVYSGIAHLITIASMLVLEAVKSWSAEMSTCYRNFLQVDTSLYWLVNSAIEVALNLPESISDIYVADIARCYESIPLTGEDNLQDAITHLIKIGFKQQQKAHPRATVLIWIRTDSTGLAASAKWATTSPSYGTWFPIDEKRLIKLHNWLMLHCYVALGDRVWQQVSGIPMGFSCSPLWCNMYLLYYESQFIQRLARLRRPDLLKKFKLAFRYIDDVCWINTQTPTQFLSQQEPRTPENPFWIYPLHVLEIKCEVTSYAADDPSRGIHAHFMNLDVSLQNVDHTPNNYRLCKYDKRRELPFAYSQYIHFQSNRPVNQSYAIVISQTVPIIYLSNNLEDATREINILISTLVRNGFKRDRLLHIVKRFLSTSQFPGAKLDMQALILSLW